MWRWLSYVAALIIPTLAQWDANVWNDRQAITHLFEWKWNDIADECERFLAPHGYGGVQISPPHECVVAWTGDVQRPWWERYQPVSYAIASRSGTEGQFKEMVRRCNGVGVRIYVDAVVNHMSGHWPSDTPSTGHSGFDAGSERYPGVPYSPYDFNDAKCKTSSGDIENYGDANQVRDCKLVGLNDIALGKEYPRQKVSDYLNKLIDFGVAGFRMDAGKHMWPGDLQNIFSRLKNLNTAWFDAETRPFIYQEVIDLGGEPITSAEYVGLGRVTEFKYGKFLGEAFRGNNQLRWLKNFGEEWGMINRRDAVVFIDNHDNQRGHGAGGQILTFRVPKLYKMATAFMLGWPYGFTRVMSSYYWEQHWVNGKDLNDWMGPPHDGDYNIASPTINADDSCGNGWMCEHRWRQIYNMVKFRNVVHDTSHNDWWDNGSNQIAFCRGNKGFLAINNDSWDMHQTLQTCLPAGTYCDVISGTVKDGSCTGLAVTVRRDGTATVAIPAGAEDGVLAIHAESKV